MRGRRFCCIRPRACAGFFRFHIDGCNHALYTVITVEKLQKRMGWSRRSLCPAQTKTAGCSACRKSLAEFRARRRENHADHFSRRRVRREKYTPACKCAGCPPLADSSCAQRAAACCRKTPKEFFDSLSGPGAYCAGAAFAGVQIQKSWPGSFSFSFGANCASKASAASSLTK